MNSRQFDALTRRVGTLSRRSLLRWVGSSVVGMVVAGLRTHTDLAMNHLTHVVKRAAAQTSPLLPPAEPWSSENPPNFDEIIDDYLDCISKGHTPEECDRGFPGFAPFDWCQLVWDVLTEALPNLAGLLSTFTPFSRNCGERDCFQCCYRPAKGCHSSYIGFPVINCNPGTYGAGTRPVGLTFIVDPDSVEPGDSCLFIPQLCTHIALCVNPVPDPIELSAAVEEIQLPDTAVVTAAPPNYLTDPRAIDQRARYFAMQVQDEVHTYLEGYATDVAEARPLQSLADALTNRGRAGWRHDLAAKPIDITQPALRVNDAAGNLNESAAWSNVAHLLAVARVLSGVPNLAERLAQVESRSWLPADKVAYLAGVGDPDQAFLSHFDAHWLPIFQRLMMLQDHALLAVPLEGELVIENQFGGQPLGKAPTLSLSASTRGTEIALSIHMDDAEDVAGGLARPVAVDWGDGRVTHHALSSGQSTLEVAHDYAVAGRYAIYVVAANDSGLRGHAALVVEAPGSLTPVVPALPSISRVRLTGLALTYLSYQKRFSVDARWMDAAGQRVRGGRSVQVIGTTNILETQAMGDLYVHNPARFDTTGLSLDLRNELTKPSSNSRVTYLTLAASLALGVFATATQQWVEQLVPLTPTMLKLYLAGDATPLPADTVTVETSGALHVPLFWRASSTAAWQKVVCADIEFTPAMFDGFSLDNSALTAPAGTQAAWVETRPGGALVEVPAAPLRVMMPFIAQ